MKNIIVTLAFCFSISAVFSQQSFVAIPENKVEQYHVNFSNIISTKEQAILLSDTLNLLLKTFTSEKNLITNSGSNLFKALSLYDEIQVLYNKLWMYFNLRISVNKKDAESKAKGQAVDLAYNINTSFLTPLLASITQQQFTGYLAEQPLLKKYSYYLKNLNRLKPHLPMAEKQKPVPENNGSLYDRYDEIFSQIKFDSVISKQGKLNPGKDRLLIESNADAAIRSEGFKKLYEGYKQSGSQIAPVLVSLAKLEDQIARAHGFSGAAESYYFDRYYTKKSVSLLLKQIVDSVSLYKYYQTIRKIYLSKKLAADNEIHLWDMKFSATSFVPRYTIDSATAIILAAVKPLGIVFQNEIANLLNPANGRMEIAPAENKRSGGFSRGFIGTQSVFYSGNYVGFYNDIRVITHEATHAVHRQLMTKAGVLPVYATGPNYFFESFAMFSEFLLSDYLIKTAPSAELKQFYLEKYFDGKGMALFTIAQDALLEQEIYDGVAFGNIRNEDDLTAANEKVNQLFSIWPTTVYPQQNLRWVTNSLFYEDPFYNINYVLGVVLALKYYEMYKADKAAFSKKYLALLTNGFTDAPAPLLKKYFNINIDDPRLLKNAFGIIRSKVDELESLYKK